MAFPPVISRIVGTRSMTWPTQVRSSPRAVIPLGQWTTSGVEIPPSLTQILWRRNGALLALAQPGPRHKCVCPDPAGTAGSCPSPRTMSVASAPLSERKKTTVSSSAHRADLVEHAANLAIHPIDHRRVDRHLRGLESLLLVGQFFPRHRMLDFARTIRLHHFGFEVTRLEAYVERHRSQLTMPISRSRCQRRCAHHVPAFEIPVSITINIFLHGMQREVRRRERQVLKEGLCACSLACSFKQRMAWSAIAIVA